MEAGDVILIDDEPAVRMAIAQTLELADFNVDDFATTQGVLERISIDWPGVIVSDINLPGQSGLALFEQVQQIDADIPFILITGHGDISMAVNAIRQGAYDFIEKPFKSDRLLLMIEHSNFDFLCESMNWEQYRR